MCHLDARCRVDDDDVVVVVVRGGRPFGFSSVFISLCVSVSLLLHAHANRYVHRGGRLSHTHGIGRGERCIIVQSSLYSETGTQACEVRISTFQCVYALCTRVYTRSDTQTQRTHPMLAADVQPPSIYTCTVQKCLVRTFVHISLCTSGYTRSDTGPSKYGHCSK